MGGRMADLRLDGITSNMAVSRLLEILRENRSKHLATFNLAVEGWRKKVAAEVAKIQSRISEGRLDTDVFIHLSKPTCNVDAYDTVIHMLESTNDTEIRLEAPAYRQLVQDQWSWTEAFETSSRAYLGG